MISVVTMVLTLAGGLLIRVADPDSFPTIGSGLWWAIQTLTTVGYGDVVPENTLGKLIATIVMINGIAFLTVITAAVTATLIDQVPQTSSQQASRTPGGADAEIIAEARRDQRPPRRDRGRRRTPGQDGGAK